MPPETPSRIRRPVIFEDGDTFMAYTDGESTWSACTSVLLAPLATLHERIWSFFFDKTTYQGDNFRNRITKDIIGDDVIKVFCKGHFVFGFVDPFF